jgi:translation elongation factor EF-G
MILIHCALQSEAQALIEHFKLNKKQTNPKIYLNDNIVLVVSNIGKQNTFKALQIVFDNYKISKAINIGIAGCSDRNIQIGAFFCTNHKLPNIDCMPLQTVNNAQTNKTKNHSLYDMEAKYFENICEKYLTQENIFVFKIVSDYLDDTILNKEMVKQLIKKNIKNIYL